jgi:hypothetical protein
MSYDFTQPYIVTTQFKIEFGSVELLNLEDELDIPRFAGSLDLKCFREREGISKKDIVTDKIKVQLWQPHKTIKKFRRYSIMPSESDDETLKYLTMLTLAQEYRQDIVDEIQRLEKTGPWINYPPFGFTVHPQDIANHITIEPQSDLEFPDIHCSAAYSISVYRIVPKVENLSLFTDFMEQLEDNL